MTIRGRSNTIYAFNTQDIQEWFYEKKPSMPFSQIEDCATFIDLVDSKSKEKSITVVFKSIFASEIDNNEFFQQTVPQIIQKQRDFKLECKEICKLEVTSKIDAKVQVVYKVKRKKIPHSTILPKEGNALKEGHSLKEEKSLKEENSLKDEKIQQVKAREEKKIRQLKTQQKREQKFIKRLTKNFDASFIKLYPDENTKFNGISLGLVSEIYIGLEEILQKKPDEQIIKYSYEAKNKPGSLVDKYKEYCFYVHALPIFLTEIGINVKSIKFDKLVMHVTIAEIENLTDEIERVKKLLEINPCQNLTFFTALLKAAKENNKNLFDFCEFYYHCHAKQMETVNFSQELQQFCFEDFQILKDQIKRIVLYTNLVSQIERTRPQKLTSDLTFFQAFLKVAKEKDQNLLVLCQDYYKCYAKQMEEADLSQELEDVHFSDLRILAEQMGSLNSEVQVITPIYKVLMGRMSLLKTLRNSLTTRSFSPLLKDLKFFRDAAVLHMKGKQKKDLQSLIQRIDKKIEQMEINSNTPETSDDIVSLESSN